MHTLSSSALASAVRLVAEVRSLMASPDDAASHLTSGLCGLVHGVGAGMCVRLAKAGPKGVEAMMLVRSGAARELNMARLSQLYSHPQLVLPNTDRLLADDRLLATSATSMMPKVRLGGTEGELYDAFLRLGGCGDRLMSKSTLTGEPERVGWLCMERERRDRPFSAGEVALVDLINQQISPWFWPAVRRAAMLDQAFG